MIWLPLYGYEGIYEISNTSLIKSLKRKVETRKNVFITINEKFLKPQLTSDGYHKVRLSKNGVTKTHSVHRLVAYTFLGIPEVKMEVNHMDLNRTNNNAINLEWLTRDENIRYSNEAGSYNRSGSKNGRSKLDENKVKEIKSMLKENVEILDISEKFNVYKSTIYKIKYGETWVHVK